MPVKACDCEYVEIDPSPAKSAGRAFFTGDQMLPPGVNERVDGRPGLDLHDWLRKLGATNRGQARLPKKFRRLSYYRDFVGYLK
jgi:hypothetical protein